MTPMGPAIRKESEADSIKRGYLCNQNAEHGLREIRSLKSPRMAARICPNYDDSFGADHSIRDRTVVAGQQNDSDVANSQHRSRKTPRLLAAVIAAGSGLLRQPGSPYLLGLKRLRPEAFSPRAFVAVWQYGSHSQPVTT